MVGITLAISRDFENIPFSKGTGGILMVSSNKVL